MKNLTRMLLAVVLAVAMLTVSGCAMGETIAPTTDPNLDVVDYTLVAADAAALQELDVYVNLKTLDLRGSDCYEAIESYIASHPQVKVTYDVDVAGTRYSSDVEQLKLEAGCFELEQVMNAMKHLPKLMALELPKTTLTAQQLQSITEAFPNLDVAYTLELLGQEVGPDLEEIDLSGLLPAQVDETLLEKLRLLPGVTEVQLMKGDGTSNFAPADVKKLMDALPNAAMNYSFEIFGQTLTTAEKRVEFIKADVGNEGIPEIRAALDILPNCTYFLMDRCGVDDEVMAQLRDDYPDRNVIWRVYFGSRYHALTDVEMINANSLSTKSVQKLKYFPDLKYLDIGHSELLDSLEFVRELPKLEILIIVDSRVVDLTPLEACPNLEYLEIVYCLRIKDLSPLSKCTKLKGLNMSANYGITDLSPLYGLEHMERLHVGNSAITQEEYEEACAAMPNCWVTNVAVRRGKISGNYAIGWRLDADGSYAAFYKRNREIFRYDEYYYSGKYLYDEKYYIGKEDA